MTFTQADFHLSSEDSIYTQKSNDHTSVPIQAIIHDPYRLKLRFTPGSCSPRGADYAEWRINQDNELC